MLRRTLLGAVTAQGGRLGFPWLGSAGPVVVHAARGMRLERARAVAVMSAKHAGGLLVAPRAAGGAAGAVIWMVMVSDSPESTVYPNGMMAKVSAVVRRSPLSKIIL